jgi:hypothetical protein
VAARFVLASHASNYRNLLTTPQPPLPAPAETPHLFTPFPFSFQIGKKGPTGLYKKWQQSTRGRIQGGGEDEESSVSCLLARGCCVHFFFLLGCCVHFFFLLEGGRRCALCLTPSRQKSPYLALTAEALLLLLVWMRSRYACSVDRVVWGRGLMPITANFQESEGTRWAGVSTRVIEAEKREREGTSVFFSSSFFFF